VTEDREDPQPQAASVAEVEAALAARQHAERDLLAAKQALEIRTRELLEQREWFEVTLASIGDAVITTDLEANVTYLNPIAEAMTGWLHKDALGKPLSQVFRIVNEETRIQPENPIEKVLQTGRIVGLANHTALIATDGREISIEDSAAPIRNTSGTIAGAVMVFHDVTRRRRAERALRASEERLRAVFTQAAVGIAIANLEGRFEEANQKFCAILGFRVEELRTRTFMDLTHPVDVERTQTQVRRLLDGVIPSYSLEKRYLRKDGAAIWSSTTVTLLRQENGVATQFIGIIEDITQRKQAEELRARLAAVVEHSDDAIITKTLDGIITTWNPGAQRIFGYAAEEVIGKPVTVLIPENQLDDEPAILERLRRGERVDHYETIRRSKTGELLDVSLTVSPLKDSNGAIIGASKIARDITRQKRAEQVLREQTTVLELLDKTGTAIISKLDLEKVLQTVTDTATQLSGAKFGAFFYSTYNEDGEALLLYTLSGASRAAFDRFGMPRNTPVFRPTFTGESVVRSADITRDPRYGTMGPHFGMPQGHLPVRSYLAAPVIARSGEVIGGLFFGHPDPDVFTERAERLVVGVAAQAAVAMDNARLFEASQRELANRERVEALLRDADRRKDEFLATLAHELRNPLAPIRQAALINQSPSASDDQKNWSHSVITRQVRHMSLLLDDLLDVSRITRGTLALRVEMTDLRSIVDAAIEQAQPLMEAKQQVFTKSLPAAPERFAGDPLRLAQVLSNLLANAAKYTDRGGRIHLEASADADLVSVRITDTGVGLAPEAIPSLFTMFRQVKASEQRAEGGLGIGLALAKGLMRLHDGTIDAHSAGIGRGSEFIVRLPRRDVPEKASRSGPEDQAAAAVRKRRVLVADDNLDAAQSLAMLISAEGHAVSVAANGSQALDLMRSELPDVALLDIGMPQLDGYEVAQRVRADPALAGIVLVAITGWGQESDKARARAAGFNLHFTKPVEPERLFEMLQAPEMPPKR
jgi:PAS domain S-box-containing protein